MPPPPIRLPLSVPIIARNEAANLERCLASVAGWVSEIVVVLNDTTDESEAVARRFGATVVHHPWLGFRDNKNVALDRCRQPWALSLDADEEVSQALREEIQAFFRTDHLQFNGGTLPRKVYFLGRWIEHGEWYPDYNMRLFRIDKARWVGGRVHERARVEGPVKIFRQPLNHFSFPDINSYLAKITTYSDHFLLEQVEAKGRWSLSQTLFRPAWRFFRSYLLRGGFLDGFPGFFVAVGAGYACFIRYSKLYERARQDRRPSPRQAESAPISSAEAER